jgi:hypothetical protein
MDKALCAYFTPDNWSRTLRFSQRAGIGFWIEVPKNIQNCEIFVVKHKICYDLLVGEIK